VDAFAGTAAGLWVVATGLDDGRHDGRADRARGSDVIAAPRLDPEGHHVLRQVRMRPLIDLVRQPVSP
jgi:hypothetical protein